jgi:hypothetical protein
MPTELLMQESADFNEFVKALHQIDREYQETFRQLADN